MKYSYTNIIGDAGEHLVAAKIIKLFGFPCRLMGIDIGIDAEIEIIDAEYKSTGQFLKCQIKTTLSKDFSICLQEKHILYWNSINIPIVVFLVHLTEEKIYWHCIKNIKEYEKSNSGVTVKFDTTNILKKSSKKTFIQLVHIKSFEEIRKIYEELYEIAHKDKVELLDTKNYDYFTVEHFVRNLLKIEYDLSKVKKLQRRNKSLIKVDEEYLEKLDEINEYISEVQELRDNILENYGPDHYDYLKNANYDSD